MGLEDEGRRIGNRTLTAGEAFASGSRVTAVPAGFQEPGAVPPTSERPPSRPDTESLTAPSPSSPAVERQAPQSWQTSASRSRPAAAPQFRHGDIALVRADAGALKAESRFTQAAEVLGRIAEPARRALGRTDSEVIALRIDLADALFLAGDHRRAAPEFAALAADIAARQGPADDLALRFRMMEATCLAMLGDTALALARLRHLLDDERRFGVDDDRTLELRRQIGLLELGAGDHAAARRTLGALLADLEQRHGPGHPSTREIRDLLHDLAD
ncbi:hypothetical protein E1286_25525 [Nonomuraea terrae]|uniref:Tetratricopeptide repeat protein n=1 Tax=Nonomuraea terrae TaxID=2530383 RepID=A0A4R4YKL9_9ACTN|nr:hypothetical protein [Nonomuraea terrae]TDD44950.1 hypothetical protein E1286_25525 [Nonomuraea terrae]